MSRRRWPTSALTALTALTALARGAAAEPVPVRVIEVAGEQAYLEPGRAAGLLPGTKVSFGAGVAVVVEATERTSALRLGELQLAVGDKGTAEVASGAGPTAVARGRMPAPRPAEAWMGQWRDPVRPATLQRPAAVPLGGGPAPGRTRLAVLGHAVAAVDRDDLAAAGEARVLASFEPATAPLSLSLDVAARAFADGYDSRTHTPLLVRAAELRWGPRAAPLVAAGRLRHAATAVGMLDGARAAVRLGALGLAAFGGVVPDPLSGKPDPSAARFGAEVSYDLPRAPLAPHLELAAHGSSFAGALDERKLAAAVSAAAGPTWLDGWAELQAFSADNPWGAATVELVGAGASAQLRRASSHLYLDLSFQRPDRSRRLAAALPLEVFCVPPVAVGDTATACAGGQWWAGATAAAGATLGRWGIDIIAQLAREHGAATGTTSSLTLRAERSLGRARLTAEAAAGKASFASWTSGALAVALAPSARTALELRYRPELLDYTASTGPALVHSLGVDVRATLRPTLELATAATGQSGADYDALSLWLFFAWRPLP